MNRREFLLFSGALALIPGCICFRPEEIEVPEEISGRTYKLETDYGRHNFKVITLSGEKVWGLCEGSRCRQDLVKELETGKMTCVWFPSLKYRCMSPTENTWITRLS